jgi:hypothetical protein
MTRTATVIKRVIYRQLTLCLFYMEQFVGSSFAEGIEGMNLATRVRLHLTSHNNYIDPFGPSPTREQQDNERDNSP